MNYVFLTCDNTVVGPLSK